jgi:hypothetical protein
MNPVEGINTHLSCVPSPIQNHDGTYAHDECFDFWHIMIGTTCPFRWCSIWYMVYVPKEYGIFAKGHTGYDKG